MLPLAESTCRPCTSLIPTSSTSTGYDSCRSFSHASMGCISISSFTPLEVIRQKRILSHNAGKNSSTKRGVPWGIIYCEISLNRDDARAREKYLKSGQGRRYLKNRLKFFFAV